MGVRNCGLALALLGCVVASAQTLPVSVQVVRESGGLRTVEVSNDSAVPVRVQLTGTSGRPSITVVPPNEVVRQALPPGTLTWSVAPDVRHPAAPEYLLPFVGRARVTQLPGCLTSHERGLRHAVDFEMPEGTPVRAAREGTVLSLADGPQLGGREPSHQVQVLHADGTWAVYGHLRAGSFLVASGQFVQAGELLAYSGNSGNSTGPHLHFAVHYLRNGVSDTLPIVFREILRCGSPLAVE